MATVSLCMIVKNEEKVLSRCLDSVIDAVDEIVIVDTGSTDNTKKIAKAYTDKVYDFEWKDDFASARNFSFSKGTKDYLMWLDADDVILPEDLKKLKELKKELDKDKTDAVMMRYNTAFDEEDNPVFYFYRERLIKRTISFEWKGRVHEVISYYARTQYSDIAVTHRSVKKEYSDRNLRIYEKQESENSVMTPRDKFYFARELYYHKYYDRAIEKLNSYLDEGHGWIENNIEACKILSYCYKCINQNEKAVEALFRSFLYDIPRADICCEIGNHFIQLQQYERAAFWFEQVFRLPSKEEISGAFINKDCYGYIPCIQLCVCYDRLGNRELAQKYNLRAGEYRPLSSAYLQNLKYFSSHK